jgi:hypothetical protein
MTNKMNLMKLTIIVISITSGVARADLIDVKKSFILECKGSDGSAYFKKTPEGIDYDIAIKNKSLHGFMHTSQVTPTGSEGSSAEIIEPSNQSNKKWLTISLLETVKTWHGPTQSCYPSRNPHAPCLRTTTPSGYKNVPHKWYSLMVDVGGNGQPKFMNLDLFGPYYKTLGTKTTCSLHYL